MSRPAKKGMRDGLIQRSKGSWSFVVSMGYVVDPVTGQRRQKQKWITLKNVTRKQAGEQRAELLRQQTLGTFIEPVNLTLADWLTQWINTYVITSTRKRSGTKDAYKMVVERHLIPALGHIELQKLRPTDIQLYYNRSSLSPATLEQHHAVLNQALKVALRQERLINLNPAELVPEKPTAPTHIDHAVWSAEEARKFLVAAAEAGTQTGVFYTLALESGMRKGELCGLKWEDVDLSRRRVSVQRTLKKPGPTPELGPPKNGRTRAIAISAEMADLLRRHREEQDRLKAEMGNGYHEYGFVFTRGDGRPLQQNNLAERETDPLIKKAGVRRIRIHDFRHTCASLLLEGNIPAKVVQERLGHTSITMTLDRYTHVAPTMQEGAAQIMGVMLSPTRPTT